MESLPFVTIDEEGNCFNMNEIVFFRTNAKQMLFWILLTETLNAIKLLKIHRKATETMITLKTWQGASHIYIVQKAIRLMGKCLSKKAFERHKPCNYFKARKMRERKNGLKL